MDANNSDLEKLAAEELLQEAKRGASRASLVGAMGWQKCPLVGSNKRFLKNTLLNTLAANRPSKVKGGSYHNARRRDREGSGSYHYRRKPERKTDGNYTGHRRMDLKRDSSYHRYREREAQKHKDIRKYSSSKEKSTKILKYDGTANRRTKGTEVKTEIKRTKSVSNTYLDDEPEKGVKGLKQKHYGSSERDSKRKKYSNSK